MINRFKAPAAKWLAAVIGGAIVLAVALTVMTRVPAGHVRSTPKSAPSSPSASSTASSSPNRPSAAAAVPPVSSSSASTASCGSPTCATLTLSPDHGPPGTVVTFSASTSLSRGASAAETILDVTMQVAGRQGQITTLYLSGDAQGGSFVLPPYVPRLGYLPTGTVTIVVSPSGQPGPTTVSASGTFTVTVPPTPTWQSLGAIHPLSIQLAAGGKEATQPGDPSRILRCGSHGSLELTPDGGQTWTLVPTASVAAALKGSGYVLSGSGGPVCETVALAPASSTLFAAFEATKGVYGLPFDWLPFETTDGGQTWSLVPAPAGYQVGSFNRFQVAGDALQALFWPAKAGGEWVEQSTNGGRSWSAGQLHCPTAGPCVAWGPGPDSVWPGVCNSQPLFWSSDGNTWEAPIWPTSVCYIGTGPQGPYELVGLSGERALLLGGANYPVRLSTDGGRTWSYIAIPPLPKVSYGQYPAVQMTGNGSLTTTWQGAFWTLDPGAAQWSCSPLPESANGACPG